MCITQFNPDILIGSFTRDDYELLPMNFRKMREKKCVEFINKVIMIFWCLECIAAVRNWGPRGGGGGSEKIPRGPRENTCF